MPRPPKYSIVDAIHVDLNSERSSIQVLPIHTTPREFKLTPLSPRLDILTARKLHQRSQDKSSLVYHYAFSTPAGREFLRANRLLYLTKEDNLFLADDHGLYVWIEQPEKRRPTPAKEAGQLSLSKRDLQVLFALLVFPQLTSESQTEIASMAGVSQATASRAIRSLEAHARAPITSEDWRGMREAYSVYWAERYLEKLRPKLATQRYRYVGDKGSALQLTVDGYERSGAAALVFKEELLANADIVELYGPPEDFKALRTYRLVPDAEGNVIVRERFWGGPPVLVVPDLLIYADLIATGDPRDREAESVVLNRFASDPQA